MDVHRCTKTAHSVVDRATMPAIQSRESQRIKDLMLCGVRVEISIGGSLAQCCVHASGGHRREIVFHHQSSRCALLRKTGIAM